MKSSGVFFLRSKPWSVRFSQPDGSGALGWILPLGERTSNRGVNTFTALWFGDEADRFIAEHSTLKAGVCLAIDLDRLHAVGNELRAHVTRCELAPPRWNPATNEPEERGAEEPSTSSESAPIANPSIQSNPAQ